ncbi:unnamed protein product [Acanthoscelides obtectus]|uniref:Secreted protein n=1 Tax=Acanthoscelides obtectus TaxID=200917 RepID=A0A9P0PHC2_ACAOB|nr:unnamed protein product [Acanthoscelides obtectus]CAK1654620.1 hypothetical protein AOBTE_LOCUS18720 [Acanthoscelides obtectus]
MHVRQIIRLIFLILLTTSRTFPQRALNVSTELLPGRRPNAPPPSSEAPPDRRDLWGATTEGVARLEGVVLPAGAETKAAPAGNYLGKKSKRASNRSRRKFRVYPVLCG